MLHGYSILLLTVALIIMIYIQSKALIKTSKGDFLAKIDSKFHSKQTLKARNVIHRYYCETYKDGIGHLRHKAVIRKRIRQLIREQDEQEEQGKRDDYMYLLNFLDELESIAYFCNQDYASTKDAFELLSGSFNYYTDLLKPIIDERRDRARKDIYYREIQKLKQKFNEFKES